MIEVEICCGDLESVLSAEAGGANRIELCSGLSEGGLTPSVGLIRRAAESKIEHINVLIRPRPGDFLYSEPEISLMEEDIRQAIQAGATGVVIGTLTATGEIDMPNSRRLISAARKAGEEKGRTVNITFHRAFDLARDWRESLENIIDLGCDCLLTSGMSSSAEKGIERLSEITEQGGDRILIMAGSGVNPGNAKKIIDETDVGAIHSTARELKKSGMTYRREGVPMGIPGMDEYSRPTTSPKIVKELIEINRD